MKKHLASIGLGSVAGVALFIILIWLVTVTAGSQSPKGWFVRYDLGRFSESSDFYTRTQVAAIGTAIFAVAISASGPALPKPS
jgi:hypothetical protein